MLPKFVPSQLPRAGKQEAKEYLEFAKQYTSSSARELQALADKARDKLQEAGVLFHFWNTCSSEKLPLYGSLTCLIEPHVAGSEACCVAQGSKCLPACSCESSGPL